MKETVLFMMTAFLMLMFFSCDNHEFNNPVDTNVTIPAIEALTVTVPEVGKLKVTWTDDYDGETGFILGRKENNTWNHNYQILPANSSQYTDNITIGSTYQYSLRVKYDENEADEVLSEQINNGIPAPQNLAFTIQNGNDIQLTWTYPASGIDSFTLELKIGSGIWTDLATNIPANTLNYIDMDVELQNGFSYRIKAYYQSYYSSYSQECSFTIPEGMVFVEGGTFLMGDHYNEGSDDELPTHNVTVSSLYISQYEVTQGEYQAIMGNNPAQGYGVGSNYPVYYVSWYDAVAYCNALSTVEGLTPCYTGSGTSITCNWNANGYRLPTEAEWEFAARGGTASDNADYRYSGSDDIGTVAWYESNSGNATHPVGTKAPNDLDIYDMSGNVWEWCWDWYDDYGSSAQTNPHGAASGSRRVLRGGSWDYYADYCRVANRNSNNPDGSYYSSGFRLLRSLN